MSLSTGATIWLGLIMAAIAVVNAGLMAWLWRFPMVPDPTGRDPNGVSTAPRSWTNAHRALGYAFLLAYLVLLGEMVPRIWEFRVVSTWSVLHAALGLFVGVLISAKIVVIRRLRRFGGRLPWIGGGLAAVTIVVVALAVPHAWRVRGSGRSLSPELARGREAVALRCFQCHGASTIASEREDPREWDRITRRMQDASRRMAGKEPIPEQERLSASAYLSTVLAETGDESGDDRDERRGGEGRRERRGRQKSR